MTKQLKDGLQHIWVKKKLHELGRATASWEDLGVPTEKRASSLPLHIKDVVNSVNWDEHDKLAISDEMRTEREQARLWRTNSTLFGKIRENLSVIKRDCIAHMPTADAQISEQFGKLKKVNTMPLAFCNAFTRVEADKHRRRGLLEPLINDIIKACNAKAKEDNEPPPFDFSVKYTQKHEIRQAVLETECGATADMSGWFDQLGMKAICDLFGVEDEDGNIYELQVTAMGFIGSCKVAHTTLGVIAPYPQTCFHAKFVDNIAFLGSRAVSEAEMATFKDRAKACGAIINDEINTARTCYEFLGEKYDHTAKTRCLTTKTVEKLNRIQQLLDTMGATKRSGGNKTTCRMFMAIIGTLFYCGEVLDIDLTKYTSALKAHARLAAEAIALWSWDHKVIISDETVAQMVHWLSLCKTNTPVHVTRGTRSDENKTQSITVYVDASAWGFGAVVMKGATVTHISQPWTPADHEQAMIDGGHLGSSVYSEPLALRRILCMVAIPPGTSVTVHSDHQPLVFAVEDQRYSFVGSYNAAISMVNDLRKVCSVRVAFIPGIANPADALSRGMAPALQVTSIGFAACG